MTLFEMTSALEKLARQAEDFQEVLGSTDEICQKIRATEKAKEAPLKFLTSFSDSHGRDDEDQMKKDVEGFLSAIEAQC